MGSGWHAAKLLEQAAAVATTSGDTSCLQVCGLGGVFSIDLRCTGLQLADGRTLWTCVQDLYSRAAQQYVECGRASTAAETLLKCARALETKDAQVRTRMGITASPAPFG